MPSWVHRLVRFFGSLIGGKKVRDERGGVTVWVVFLAVALLAGAGLVIDGGYALSAKRRAMNHAEQAARVASDELSQASLRNGTPAVNAARANSAAHGYLASVGAHGSVDINGGQVTVIVSDDYDPAILSIVGVNRINVKARATAESIDEDDNP
jgi:Flp pilus assembly protein TadG